MLKAMPSPKGTNTALKFITTKHFPRAADARGAAYDSVNGLDDEAVIKLINFLRGKLNDEDLAAFCKLAGVADSEMSMDDEGGPPPFPGMPRTDDVPAAMDSAATKSFAARWPHAARIKVSA